MKKKSHDRILRNKLKEQASKYCTYVLLFEDDIVVRNFLFTFKEYAIKNLLEQYSCV